MTTLAVNYYYGMCEEETGKTVLLSCVVSIEGHGYELQKNTMTNAVERARNRSILEGYTESHHVIPKEKESNGLISFMK